MTGEELRQIRRKLGLNQAGLAKVLGLKEKSISQLETGKMNISKSVELHALTLLKLHQIKKVLELP